MKSREGQLISKACLSNRSKGSGNDRDRSHQQGDKIIMHGDLKNQWRTKEEQRNHEKDSADRVTEDC